MAAIHWVLIALEVGVGVVLTAIGMFKGSYESVESQQPGLGRRPLREFATVVWFTALYPIVVTLVIGWLGPQPHGSFWLTVATGIASAVVARWLTAAGLAFHKQGAGILAVVGVSLPASCTTLVYNMAWLFPNARFPSVDFF